jgi:N-acyl-D-amino-acid deacylase
LDLSAGRAGISQRGYLREGYYADIVVMDEMIVREREELGIPLPPAGIDKVIVNGNLLINDAREVSDRSTGRVIKV